MINCPRGKIQKITRILIDYDSHREDKTYHILKSIVREGLLLFREKYKIRIFQQLEKHPFDVPAPGINFSLCYRNYTYKFHACLRNGNLVLESVSYAGIPPLPSWRCLATIDVASPALLSKLVQTLEDWRKGFYADK